MVLHVAFIKLIGFATPNSEHHLISYGGGRDGDPVESRDYRENPMVPAGRRFSYDPLQRCFSLSTFANGVAWS